ncbi:Relaxase/Mobilisation nuclease domain-containing protein [Dyadobacter sp. SG02]|uniref:relaxase/mobilization nuclease domain-containing protein n=1 Tax=Dyadobacter sp. SG02 TaxID=1855291 RepID=UPI0008D403AC|nr:relaxase/mobilization nuclease domain-containing protein [Dyadobacter sp. SG02]SEJ52604.1 Relaxase/Mobilisation nuclease domain-containing protein [Dyadobacter sp. SG02]
MVAVIHSGSSLKEALNYNENKVKRGVAECIDAGYYVKDVEDLSYRDKFSRLQKLMNLNSRTKVNTLHISLNFAAEDKLDKASLRQIAGTYLDKIGFASQPYLLYEHHDAGHQHVHILTTNIRPDGTAINLHNIGKTRSEAARKDIEGEFSLVRAEDRKRKVFELKAVGLSPLQYGRAETKQAISNVLQSVINEYHYTSLAELNAVLAQYNVYADPGAEGSRVNRGAGLLFRVLDTKGQSVGVPIKASDFHFKPTLKSLQPRFLASKFAREKYAVRLKNTIDKAVSCTTFGDLTALQQTLKSEGVALVLRASKTGLIYGLTYVDHRTKAVFNGSDLGKAYSAKAIQEALAPPDVVTQQKTQYQSIAGNPSTSDGQFKLPTFGGGAPVAKHETDEFLASLFLPESGEQSVPWQLRKPPRRRGR